MADVVLAPGGKFGPAAGMLMYAAAVPERRGATVYRHEWSRKPSNPFEPDIERWVCAELAPAMGRCRLVIGKSLGSNAARLAARRAVPAIWLTPTLTLPWVVDALDRPTAPFLLVGGTADTTWWDGATARRLTPHVLEIEDADHGLMMPGPVRETITALSRMIIAMDEFLDVIEWKERP